MRPTAPSPARAHGRPSSPRRRALEGLEARAYKVVARPASTGRSRGGATSRTWRCAATRFDGEHAGAGTPGALGTELAYEARRGAPRGSAWPGRSRNTTARSARTSTAKRRAARWAPMAASRRAPRVSCGVRLSLLHRGGGGAVPGQGPSFADQCGTWPMPSSGCRSTCPTSAPRPARADRSRVGLSESSPAAACRARPSRPQRAGARLAAVARPGAHQRRRVRHRDRAPDPPAARRSGRRLRAEPGAREGTRSPGN